MNTFATAGDVAARLGRTLTTDEQNQATAVIGTVSGLILEAVGRDDEWADDLDPVPVTFKAVCVEKVVSILANPDGLASLSKTLGSFTHSATFPRAADIGIFLSPLEVAAVRTALSGGLRSGSARMRSIVDDVIELTPVPVVEL